MENLFSKCIKLSKIEKKLFAFIITTKTFLRKWSVKRQFFYENEEFFKDLAGNFRKVLLATIFNVAFLGGGPPTSCPFADHRL